MKKKIVYLSGAISSDSNFKQKFDSWAAWVLAQGAKSVLNPVTLPPGWEYVDYMDHCLLMVRRADILLMLPDWSFSNGAKAEHAYARSLKKEIIYATDILEERTVPLSTLNHQPSTP